MSRTKSGRERLRMKWVNKSAKRKREARAIGQGFHLDLEKS